MTSFARQWWSRAKKEIQDDPLLDGLDKKEIHAARNFLSVNTTERVQILLMLIEQLK